MLFALAAALAPARARYFAATRHDEAVHALQRNAACRLRSGSWRRTGRTCRPEHALRNARRPAGAAAVTYTVNDDPNFAPATKISGVPLEELARTARRAPRIAIGGGDLRRQVPRKLSAGLHCGASSAAGAEREWRAARRLAERSRNAEVRYGAVHDLASEVHAELQDVWLTAMRRRFPGAWCGSNFATKKRCWARLLRAGRTRTMTRCRQGYRIAQQNCFRCHNMGSEGGQKSGRPWLVLAAWANADPDYFASYVRDPKKRIEHAEMPGNPGLR